ncbi:MAG TPA: penicillin acylase family protein [Ktedonobacterales bacterium]|jgi:penicillin amidase
MASLWRNALALGTGVVGLVSGVTYVMLRRPLPKIRGEERLPGLTSEVEVIRDGLGVPHLFANTLEDLYFAQGYVHAQDRLWQMELNRRTAAGRLSEIFGEIALEADRFIRRIGLRRAAEQDAPLLSEESRRLSDAYSAGVNAFIERHTGRLPLEMVLLRLKPEPWSVVDSLSWGKMMAWSLAGNWESELLRAKFVSRLGPERAARIEPLYGRGDPLIVPPGATYEGLHTPLLDQYRQMKELVGILSPTHGSNNWVVDGTRTLSGKPMLANDPHLAAQMPGIWHHCHLNTPGLDVIGATLPGLPGVIIGRNRRIAWGVTNAGPDTQDLYLERFNPENPRQYDYQGAWEEAKVIREEIRVKGRVEPEVEEVVMTRHGPIITGMEPGGQPMALRWTSHAPATTAEAVLGINRAGNWEEFTAALRHWDAPAQNFVYADVDGNIGYYMAGRVPVRAKGQGLLPVPGWTGEYEWAGTIPFEELPQAYNPPSHQIVTANNRIVGDDFPHFITHEYFSGYRARRITDLLNEGERLTPADMAAIQGDFFSIPASQIVPHLLKLEPRNETQRQALGLLRSWNFALDKESAAAAIYEVFLLRMLKVTFGSVLGEELAEDYVGKGLSVLSPSNMYAGRSTPLLIDLLNEGDTRWFAESALPRGPKNWQEAMQASFEGALDELRGKLGRQMAGWQWGRLHGITFGHPLGQVKPLHRLFNRGPFPVSGDTDTVCQMAFAPGKPYAASNWSPSFRQIIDLADTRSGLFGYPTGQSGHPGSPHYADMIETWLAVKHYPLLYERDQIEAAADGKLTLKPT